MGKNEKLLDEFKDLLSDNLEAIRAFESLCSSKQRNESAEERLLKYIKSGEGPKVFKKVKKLVKKLEYEVEIDEVLPGPTVSHHDIHSLKERIEEFLDSKFFYRSELPADKDKIRFYLFGSLVSGFGGDKSKHSGVPSDQGRVSDVDLGIIIGKKFFDSFVQHHITVKGSKRSYPLDDSSRELGPFRNIFQFLKGLSIAKRRDRQINIVFIEKSFFLKLKLRDEPHKRILEKFI